MDTKTFYKLITILLVFLAFVISSNCQFTTQNKPIVLKALYNGPPTSPACDNGVLLLFEDGTCEIETYLPHSKHTQHGTFNFSEGLIKLSIRDKDKSGCKLFVDEYNINFADSLLSPVGESQNRYLSIKEISRGHKIFKRE